MANIISLWRNTKKMPLLLGMFCQGAMVICPVFVALLLVPIFGWTIEDRQVSYAELWSSGAGLFCLVAVLGAGTGSWGLAARKMWARWVCSVTPVAPFILATIHPATWFTQKVFEDVSPWPSAIATSAVIAACLFLLPSVKRYLSLWQRNDHEPF